MKEAKEDANRLRKIRRYENDLEILEKENRTLFQQIEGLNDHIQVMEAELFDYNTARGELIQTYKENEKSIQEFLDKISDLEIICKLKCEYQKDPARCPKRDKSKCVYLHNRPLTEFIKMKKGGEII